MARRYLRLSKGSGEKTSRRFFSFIVGVSIAGIALGTATLIVALSILSGFERTLTDNITGYTAHVEILVYGARPIPNHTITAEHLRKNIPQIKTISPFVAQEIILRTSKGITGLVLKGVQHDDPLAIGLKKIVKGTNFTKQADDSLPQILISSGVARDLATDVGKAVTGFRFHQGIRSREELLDNLKRFRVVGIYETGMSEYDNTLAYTTLEAGQKFVGMTDKQASGYLVLGSSLSEARKLTEQINKTLRYPFYATSVYEVYQTIFAWIELQKKPIPIILGLIIIVAAFNIISTLLIMVIEKTRSIGVLKTLGARDTGIASIFLTEGLTISMIGVLLGDLLAFILCYIQLNYQVFTLRSDIYFMSSVPIDMRWEHYLIVSLVSITIALCATLVPARIASRIKPLTALKFG